MPTHTRATILLCTRDSRADLRAATGQGRAAAASVLCSPQPPPPPFERESGTGVEPRRGCRGLASGSYKDVRHKKQGASRARKPHRKQPRVTQSREETHVRQRVTRDRRVKCQGGTTESSYYLRIPTRAATCLLVLGRCVCGNCFIRDREGRVKEGGPSRGGGRGGKRRTPLRKKRPARSQRESGRVRGEAV